MQIARLAVAGAALTFGWALYAKPVPSLAPPPSANELVITRQAGMDMTAATYTLLKNASANGTPIKNLAFPASGIAKFASVLPALFPESTRNQPSRAKATIWTDRAGFKAKAADFATATKALAAAAASDDKPAFDTALAAVGAACKGCHDNYQIQLTPPPPKPAG